MLDELKKAIGGFGVLLAITLFFYLVQFQIDRLHFVDMTWGDWLHRQITRMIKLQISAGGTVLVTTWLALV